MDPSLALSLSHQRFLHTRSLHSIGSNRYLSFDSLSFGRNNTQGLFTMSRDTKDYAKKKNHS